MPGFLSEKAKKGNLLLFFFFMCLRDKRKGRTRSGIVYEEKMVLIAEGSPSMRKHDSLKEKILD